MTIEFAKLAEPFHASEIEWRIGRAGKNNQGVWATAFAYVTNRAIQQRLDEVCGPGNWKNEFSTPPNAPPASAALCTIYIRIDGEWVGKSDGADNSDMESTKGGLSDSMKRAAVQWGIGRYLYDLEEGWVTASVDKQKDWRYQAANDKKGIPAFYWQPPQLPAWALPLNTKPEPKPAAKSPAKQVAEQHGMKTADELPGLDAYHTAIGKVEAAVRARDPMAVAKIVNYADGAGRSKLSESEHTGLMNECTLALQKIKAAESEPVAA
jgi:hypothetical protein